MTWIIGGIIVLLGLTFVYAICTAAKRNDEAAERMASGQRALTQQDREFAQYLAERARRGA